MLDGKEYLKKIVKLNNYEFGYKKRQAHSNSEKPCETESFIFKSLKLSYLLFVKYSLTRSISVYLVKQINFEILINN